MDYSDELCATVTERRDSLRRISDDAAAMRPSPDAWSAKEIIGHLIDSASNNHQRFVRARWQDDLIFPGYEQDGWVAAQRYNDRDWLELVDFWALFNRHLAHVMDSVPDEVRLRPHTRHNLHERAWTVVPAGQPTTLDYFMRDYVGHLRHHLRQLDALNLPVR
ncbi:MAG: DinB family protein [Gemmatimonadaceae bacterium]|nr:DinB family protein [Gemmatimonadaceae bacterium]